jgi:hypothetical protein
MNEVCSFFQEGGVAFSGTRPPFILAQVYCHKIKFRTITGRTIT